MKYGILLLALVFSYLIASCSQDQSTINAMPIEELSPPVTLAVKNYTKPILVTGPQTCGGAMCAKGQECLDNKCVCGKDNKKCGDACIAKESCCSDSDCQGTENCILGKCEFSCSRVICPANQICSQDEKRCTCPEDYRFCQPQNKCIPKDYCCDRFDCGRDSVCTQTVYSAHVCLNSKQPFCKYLGDKITKTIAVNNRTYDVTASEFLYGNKVKIVVDGKAFTMENGGKQKVSDGLTLAVDDVRELGGRCRVIDEGI
ncbi:MAG: hypothetical protein AABX47_10305 [Nanoarchaeota archaeon]